MTRRQGAGAFADLSQAEQARLIRSTTDYRELYGRLRARPRTN